MHSALISSVIRIGQYKAPRLPGLTTTVRNILIPTIRVKHTYSLLGVTGTEGCSTWTWTVRYVVLRNPYGTGKGDPTGLPAGSLYTGALWCQNINLGNNDGIFALSYDLFAQYFAGYAWMLL